MSTSMSISLMERQDTEAFVRSYYKELVERCFGGMYMCCYQTGSFIYGGGTPGKSDLDISVLFKDESYDLPKIDLLRRIREFVTGYLHLHAVMGYAPDLSFPGEYVTAAMCVDAIEGRGFHAGDEY